MDVNVVTEMFEQVGLTASVIGAFAWYILRKDKEKAIVDKEMRERQMSERDMLIQTIEKYRAANEALLQTNKEMSEAHRLMMNEFLVKMTSIEHTVVEIRNKVNSMK